MVNTRKVSAPGKVASPPKGKAKSGRPWKLEKQRASSMIKGNSKPGRAGAEEARDTRKSVKALADGLRTEIAGEATAKREREAANRERKAEATKNAEIVQVVRNSAKLKRMKKKALKTIEKRDTGAVTGGGGNRALRSNCQVDGVGLP